MPKMFYRGEPPASWSLLLHHHPLSLSRRGIDAHMSSRRLNIHVVVVVGAIKEEDSQQFEVDPDKAREALRNLDQQFQSRSQKSVRPRPKKQAPYVNLSRNQTDVAAEEFTGSFFTYAAIALFAFSIFYNVLFYTVIKPSVDGFSEGAPTSVVTEISK